MELQEYAARIEYAGEFAPTIDVLRALHLAHATHIPFENLDILLGRPIRLDLASLQAKLVHGGRGGDFFQEKTPPPPGVGGNGVTGSPAGPPGGLGAPTPLPPPPHPRP